MEDIPHSTSSVQLLTAGISSTAMKHIPGVSPIAFISSAVRKRLPRVPGMRRTMSVNSINYDSESTTTLSSTATSTGASTPTLNHESAMVLLDPQPGDRIGEPGYYNELLHTVSEEALVESTSGISWKFANQGMNLLDLAAQESIPTLSETNASFTRQIYIHALTYLLKGLPNNMTPEEQLSIRSALPPGTVEPVRYEVNTAPSAPRPPREPSLLHRTLASTIVQLFILIQFLLPYIKTFLQILYQYERQYHFSERVLKHGIDSMDTIGKRGLMITAAIYDMGDGKVGQIISEVVTWIVEGVAGGLHEGIGEGMNILGARRPPPKTPTTSSPDS